MSTLLKEIYIYIYIIYNKEDNSYINKYNMGDKG